MAANRKSPRRSALPPNPCRLRRFADYLERAIKEQSEATVAVAVAQADPNETTIAQMRREVREAIAAGCELLGIRVPFSAQQHQQHQQVS